MVTADRFFSEKLALGFSSNYSGCPIIHLKGVVTHEQSEIRTHDVNVYGIDERFWKFQNIAVEGFQEARAAFVGSMLAEQLNAHIGDGLLLRVEAPQAIPREYLYGRRDTSGKTVRLNCRAILPPDKLGEFSLRPTQGNVYSIFIPLKLLQKELSQPSLVNAILLNNRSTDVGQDSIRAIIKKNCTLQDLGLKLKSLPANHAFSIESQGIILDNSIAETAVQVATNLGMQTSAVYTYLANSIRANGREIPYSAISAADLGKGALTSVRFLKQSSLDAFYQDPNQSILLTDWAWRNLAVSKGEPVEIDYFLWLQDGRLVTRTARFRFAGVVAISGDVNASLSPDIPGVTGSESISAWDPPFPLELNRIRRVDEDYWDRYKATPKAFISLARGQELWQNRFGKITSVRVVFPNSMNSDSGRDMFSRALLEKLNLHQSGFLINPIKNQGVTASQGSTDFGEYFLYFSSFLIAAAIMLSALFFKLMTEQRIHEIGILTAAGFPAGILRRIFLLEGGLLISVGSLIGVLASLGYGWILIFGLRTVWMGAVGTQHLFLHVSWMDIIIGIVSGIILSFGAIVWTLRDLRRYSPRNLLAGVLESITVRRRRVRILLVISIVGGFSAGILLVCSAFRIVSQLAGFFGAGFLLLISILCATATYLRRSHPKPIQGNGWPAFIRFALKNAMHRPGRSLLCAALIASATFIIVSMEAFRQDEHSISLNAKSGTGGYSFLGQSDLPIIHNLNSDSGREAAGIPSSEFTDLKNVAFTSFRERPGDDTSCLNLYAPQEPRILGAPHEFLTAGRFGFQDSLASSPEQQQNPWLLLESPPQNGVIPAIADANTIQYILHLSIGSEISVRGSKGNPVRIRLVAALKNSIFQGELLISEANFLRAFPEQEGYRFFLLSAPQNSAAEIMQTLKERLSDWGFNIESTRERLEAYNQVENTYLSTFQSLGSLGLILGTVGLAGILLRNVLERRQELALLRAIGYRKKVLSGIILAENIVLILWGLATGTICAFLAILPAIHSRGGSIPFVMTAWILIGVLSVGIVSSFFASLAAFRLPLLTSLRSE